MAPDSARGPEAGQASRQSNGEQQLEHLFTLQKKAYAKAPFPSYEQRLERLDKLIQMLEANEARFAAAVNADFGNRSIFETTIAEILVTLGAARHAKKNLRKWMQPRGVATPLHMLPSEKPHRTATARRRRHYLAVELSPPVGAGARGSSDCRGQSRDDQAERANAAYRRSARRRNQ